MSKAEFINEQTRFLLVKAAEAQVLGEDYVLPGPFLEHAMEKGWVSKKDGTVLAKGFKAAAAFLRR